MGITFWPRGWHQHKRNPKVLAEAKRVRGPVLVHVRTIKGEDIFLPSVIGALPWNGLFDIDTGVPLYHQEKRITRMCSSTVMLKMGSGSRRWLRLPQRWQTEPV